MGLIKSAMGAIGGTLHDQWKEVIRCDDMDNDILMVKRTTENGVISNGSTVIVAPGQAAIIYDNGRILDASAEEGIYTFDTSSTPSLFAGQFGGMFKEMWQRFTYDGASAKEQAVYFFNLKEIIGNKFGTPNVVMYKDWGHAMMNARTNSYIPMTVNVKCFGTYTFRISDPFLFMSKLAGTASIYRKDELTGQMKSEIIASFSNVMNSLGSDEYKKEVFDLPNQTDEIKEIMDKNVFDENIRKRGIELVAFNVENVSLDAESQAKIDKYEIGGDAYQQQGELTSAYAQAVQNAASNEGGAINGFMGIGMMNMTSGSVFNNTNGTANAAQPMQPQADAAKEAQQPMNNTIPNEPVVTNVPEQATNEVAVETNWECPNCHKTVEGKFCGECGQKRLVECTCKKCGTKLSGTVKFCGECGTKVE